MILVALAAALAFGTASIFTSHWRRSAWPAVFTTGYIASLGLVAALLIHAARAVTP